MTDSAVGAPASAVSAASPVDHQPSPSEPQLVQLLTPEGERVEHPDVLRRPHRRGAARALPRPRPGPPGRRRGDRPAAPGRARHLGQPARPGGRPGRLRPRAARGRLRLPDLPRARRRLVPRRRPAQPARPVPRRQPRRLGPEREELPPLHDRHRRADAARHRLRDGHAEGRRRRRRHRLLRRRRDQPGRRQRGVHLRQRLQRPGRVLLPEQPVGDLRAAREADPHPALPAGAAASASPASGSTATTCSPCYAVTKAALHNAREGNGPTLIEAYTYRMGAHTTSDDPTRYRLADELESWKLKDPIERVKAYLVRTGHRRPGLLRRGRGGGRRAGRARAQGLPRDARPRAAVDLRPRLRRAAPARRGGARAVRAPTSTRSRGVPLMTQITLGQGHQRWACARPWRTTPRSSSWARTSASSAASSGSPTACRRTSARTGSSTPRSPSPASSAPRSAWRCAATGRSARSSSTGSSTRRSTRSSASWPRCAPASLGKVVAAGRRPHPVRRRHRRGRAPQRVHEAYFAHTAGLKVVACSNPVDAYWMIQQAIASDDPVIFFEPKRRYWEKAELDESLTLDSATPLHSARVVREGTDVTVAAYGPMVKTCWRPRPPRPRRASRSRSSTCARCRRSTCATLRRLGREDRPAGRRARGAGLPRHGRRDRRPGHRARASTRWRRRCCGSAASTRPTRRAGSRRTTCPTSTGCSTPSTARSRSEEPAHADASSSSSPTSARASPRPRSSRGRSSPATPSRSTRSSSRSRPPSRWSSCRRRSPAWSASCSCAEGTTVDVGTPIITVDDGTGGTAPATRRRATTWPRRSRTRRRSRTPARGRGRRARPDRRPRAGRPHLGAGRLRPARPRPPTRRPRKGATPCRAPPPRPLSRPCRPR